MRAFAFRCLTATVAVFSAIAAYADQPITITFLHTNDLHARVEGVKIKGKMYGGYSRQATLIEKYRKSDPNPILLNGGDTFQGTIFFNVYEGLADLAYMNYIGYQAMAVGNHEFDRGPAALAAFAKEAKFPILAANLDVSGEKALEGLVKPSTVIEVGGTKVGIVGAVTPELPDISSPGDNVKMLDLVQSVQKAVDDLTRLGINKIVLLTHIGYNLDKQLAQTVKDVDVIVGGHSHSPLDPPKIDGFPPSAGDYPTEIKGAGGQMVLVVQAWEWGKVLGRLRVRFDRTGKVESYQPDKPIVIDESVPEDPVVKAMVSAFLKPIAAQIKQVIGEAAGEFRSERPVKGIGNSIVGNLLTDAMLAQLEKSGAVVAFMNRGGIRADIESGPITYGAALSVQPFGNTLVLLDMRGSEILAVLEQSVEAYPERGGGILHPSKGSSYTVDLTKPAGLRISNVIIAGAALDPNKTYRIGLNSFTAQGGDGLTVFKECKGARTDTGFVDFDALLAYIKANSPIKPNAEKRFQEITPPIAGLWQGVFKALAASSIPNRMSLHEAFGK